MLLQRPAAQRGQTHLGWLKSYHTFSFGDYVDEQHNGFGCLRVINDDWIEPGKGFATHGHRDMEIITYVLQGQLAHKDSMGNGSIITAGEVQKMSAGTGITHSEYNASDVERVHLLQIWVYPQQKGLTPQYQQQRLNPEMVQNQFYTVASNQADSPIHVYQDMSLSVAKLEANQSVILNLASQRQGWFHVATGAVYYQGQLFEAGDGFGVTEPLFNAAVEGVDSISDLLWFDLAQSV